MKSVMPVASSSRLDQCGYRPRERSQSMMIWAICWLLLSSIIMCSLPVMAPGEPG